MAETGDGVDELRARVERRSRSVPPPRRPRNDAVSGIAGESDVMGGGRDLGGGNADGGGEETSSRPTRAPAADVADRATPRSVSSEGSSSARDDNGEAAALVPEQGPGAGQARSGGVDSPRTQGAANRAPGRPGREVISGADKATERRTTAPTGVSPVPEPEYSPTGVAAEPTANLTLRVRQSLDFRLAELIHGLRCEGVRSTKKELIEMCLSELPTVPTDELRDRLRAYRDRLPRDL